MKQFDWTKSSAIAEILSAIAIVLTLAYLAIQTKQNTQALELGAYQDLMSQISQINTLAVENPEVAAWLLENRERRIPESDWDSDYLSARALTFLVTRHGDMAFHLLERDAITQERFDSAIGPLRDNICYPFWQQAWEFGDDNFVPKYQALINGYIRDCP